MPADPVDEAQRRRASDAGLGARARVWWDAWGALVSGLWLVIVSAAVLVIAISFYSSQAETDQAAKVSCERSRKYGPKLAIAYARYHILSDQPGPHGEPSELETYRATIPKKCPS